MTQMKLLPQKCSINWLLHSIVIALLAVTLAACSGLPKPDLGEPTQAMVAAEFSYRGALETVNAMIDNDVLDDPDDAKLALEIIQRVDIAFANASEAVSTEDPGWQEAVLALNQTVGELLLFTAQYQ